MSAPRYGIASLSEIDNLDDRREVFYLLSLLTDEERKKFLLYCVREINRGIVFTHDPPHVLLEVRVETGTINETYMDLMLAIAKYNLPIKALLEDLVKYVSGLQKLTENYRIKALEVPLTDFVR